jgi:hypothetical protein
MFRVLSAPIIRITINCSSRSIDRYAPGGHIIYTQPHNTQNFINQNPKLACNSEGKDELPEDGTQLPKPVVAAK